LVKYENDDLLAVSYSILNKWKNYSVQLGAKTIGLKYIQLSSWYPSLLLVRR